MDALIYDEKTATSYMDRERDFCTQEAPFISSKLKVVGFFRGTKEVDFFRFDE